MSSPKPARLLSFTLIRDDVPEAHRSPVGSPPAFLVAFRTPDELAAMQKDLEAEPSYTASFTGPPEWPSARVVVTSRARLFEAITESATGEDLLRLVRDLTELNAKFDALPERDGARTMVHGVQVFAGDTAA